MLLCTRIILFSTFVIVAVACRKDNPGIAPMRTMMMCATGAQSEKIASQAQTARQIRI